MVGWNCRNTSEEPVTSITGVGGSKTSVHFCKTAQLQCNMPEHNIFKLLQTEIWHPRKIMLHVLPQNTENVTKCQFNFGEAENPVHFNKHGT
jgi:hypothetical protein